MARRTVQKWSRPLPCTADRITAADYESDSDRDSRYGMFAGPMLSKIHAAGYTCSPSSEEWLERVAIEARMHSTLAVRGHDDGVPVVTRIFANSERVVMHAAVVGRRESTGPLIAGEIAITVRRRIADQAYATSNTHISEDDDE